MTKKNLFKIIAIAFLLFILVGLLFFRKGDDEVLDPNLIPANNQQVEEPDEKHKLTEEEKAKIFAENFVVTYYSYAWGNFSNVESQYYYMTEEMKSREEIKVEQMRREIKDQPQRYFTARARLLDSKIISYEKTRTSVNINLSIDNFAGAIIQRDTMVWVDENGDYYERDLDDLIIDTLSKNVQINIVRIGNEWKVDRIGEK